MAHSYAHLYRTPCTGLRFFTVYGPWGRPDMALFKFTRGIVEGTPITVFNGGDMIRDFTYVDDIVEGIVRVVDRPAAPDPQWRGDEPDPATSRAPYRIYNIGNNTPVKLMRYIEVLEQCLGRKAVMQMLPMQPGDVQATAADVSNLEQAVGFRPRTSVEDGVARFVAWYRDFYGVGARAPGEAVPVNISVFGCGYVGLVTGACFAEMGNNVTCVDSDSAKIAALKQGSIPIHEPGLDQLVTGNVREGQTAFHHIDGGRRGGRQHIFHRGRHASQRGRVGRSHQRDRGRARNRRLIEGPVHDRGQVHRSRSEPPTASRRPVRAELERRGVRFDFDVVSNPEFLKEGDAISDFMKPDRVIVGTRSERAAELMRRLYAPFTRNHERMLVMGVRDAELTKYAANSMLAARISFMNEIATLCERVGVDVENVRKGIGSDARIGYSFIYAGCGYGGSCFPKDVRALAHTAREHGVDPTILQAVEARNEAQKRHLYQRIVARFGTDLGGLTFGLWGLAFKPGTDDMREAPSVVLLRDLIGAGAKVRAYDPAAMEAARRMLPAAWFESGRLTLTDHQYDALDGAAALALVTEWKPFRYPDFAVVKKRMKQAVIFDGRNLYDPAELAGLGFEYCGIGR
jgi:UDPglucose 6-dehydrogenase